MSSYSGEVDICERHCWVRCYSLEKIYVYCLVVTSGVSFCGVLLGRRCVCLVKSVLLFGCEFLCNFIELCVFLLLLFLHFFALFLKKYSRVNFFVALVLANVQFFIAME